MARKSNGHAWRKLQADVYRTETHCGLCGGPVDQSQPRINPDGTTNKASKSVDHIIPVTQGGAEYDRENCQLAHLGCNMSKNDGRNAKTVLVKRVRTY